MEKEYKCECGKIFYSSQSFNAHQGKCKVHLGEDKYKRILEKNKQYGLKGAEKITKIRLEKKLEKEKAWVEEKHTCEYCGKVMDIRYGSGRFCSRLCAKRFSNEHRKDIRKSDSERVCKICGKKLKSNQIDTCSRKCYMELNQRKYITNWKLGKLTFDSAEKIPPRIRRYMLEKTHYKCEKCGWGETNPTTGLIPLQIHHIDGNPYNHAESNLQVLCPNCHSLTETFGALNTGNGRAKNKWYKED